MPFQLRHIDDLAEELGSAAKAKSALVSADVRVINGFYDHGALEAVFAEPKATNVGRAKKNLFTLSETDGIGAIKHCLDKVDLDIVRHLYHGTNFITARNAKGKRRRMKVYSASRTRTQWQIAYFQCTGFLDHRNPGYYLFVCYEGPIAWAMSRNDLIAMHKKCLKHGGYLEGDFGFSIPKSKLSHKTGTLRCSFEAADETHLLTSKRQLGL
jgi:hypothetical protein